MTPSQIGRGVDGFHKASSGAAAEVNDEEDSLALRFLLDGAECLEVVLPVVHRLHHAICLDFYNRMADDATSDIWVHSNAISKHMATKGGYYGSIWRGLNNFSKIL